MTSGIIFFNAKENELAYETTTSRINCKGPSKQVELALTAFTEVDGLMFFDDRNPNFWPQLMYSDSLSDFVLRSEETVTPYRCSTVPPTVENAELVRDTNLKYRMKKEREERERQERMQQREKERQEREKERQERQERYERERQERAEQREKERRERMEKYRQKYW